MLISSQLPAPVDKWDITTGAVFTFQEPGGTAVGFRADFNDETMVVVLRPAPGSGEVGEVFTFSALDDLNPCLLHGPFVLRYPNGALPCLADSQNAQKPGTIRVTSAGDVQLCCFTSNGFKRTTWVSLLSGKPVGHPADGRIAAYREWTLHAAWEVAGEEHLIEVATFGTAA